MSERLKPGWRRVKFGEVVRQVKDKVDPATSGLKRYIAGEHMDSDDLRLHRWGEIGAGYLGPAFHMRFKPGQVLYGSRRTYLRKVAVADFEGITANTTYVLDSKDPRVLLPELLPFLMQTEGFNEHSIQQSRGSVNPYVNFSDLAWYEFALPPLEEQLRLTRLLSTIEHAFEVEADSKVQIDVVRVAALTQWQASWERSHGLSFLSDLLREKPRNGFSPKTNSSGDGYKTVSISSIRNGIFSPTGCTKYAVAPLKSVSQFFVEKGDVFVVRGNGNRGLAGLAGIAEGNFTDTFYPDLLIRVRFDQEKIDPTLATAMWNSPVTHTRLISRAKSTNGIWKINGQDLRAHTLAVPPIDVQVKARAILDSLAVSQACATARLTAHRALKFKVLAQLQGVPQ